MTWEMVKEKENADTYKWHNEIYVEEHTTEACINTPLPFVVALYLATKHK